MDGYNGRILRVDLSSRRVSTEEVGHRVARSYLGGSGMGIRMAFDEIAPTTDPLSPENKLIFATGPLTGTALGTTGRHQLVTKAPLTGLLCDCSSGGYWGARLHGAGYDVLVVEGIAAKPTYLEIGEGGVVFRDASSFWGADTFSVQNEIQRQAGGRGTSVAAIGMAGERRALYAAIMNDEARAAARGGVGAVMGAKKLKAIAVRGNRHVQLKDEERFAELAKATNKRNSDDPGLADLRKYGTSDVLDSRWAISDIPVRNWGAASSEATCTPVGGRRLLGLMPKKPKACYRCTIGCARWVRIADGPYRMDAPGPEYESSAALGPLCLVSDLKAVCYANHLCNAYGIDTISAGSSIAFAMECHERGLVTIKDLDGLDLRWGNAEAMIQMIHKIGKLEGAGALLAQGTRRMAETIGGGSEDFAVHVKGLELPMHDARAGFAWAVNYATGSRGGCHLHGMTDLYEESTDPIPEWGFTGKYTRLSDEGKAEMARFAQCWAHVLDSLVMCYFATVLLKPSDFCALIQAATGWEFQPADLLLMGDRINAVHRAYNWLCGVRPRDDRLPARALEPLASGGAAGKTPNLQQQLARYYEVRGWDNEGRPSQKRLIELSLPEIAKRLESR